MILIKNEGKTKHPFFIQNFIFLVRSERIELSWTKSTRPSTVPVYQFQHDRNMPHIKSMTERFQIDKF